MSTKVPAVFLDRDGTINIEKHYLYRIEDFELLPGAGEGIALLTQSGYRVVVISNQSGIGRGYNTEADVHRLHHYLDQLLKPFGAQIDAYYFCPHHPAHGQDEYQQECACRKPLPGMILQAATDLNIDLAQSFMVGDKLVDIEAGHAAGCRTLLVRTGYGAGIEQQNPNVQICDDLLAAAICITKNQQTNLNI